MPSCRSCHRARLGGPLQEEQQLVKYQRGSKPHIIVNTPTYVGSLDQRLVHQHLPKLFHHARNEGDRVVHPLEIFAQNFTQFGDPRLYSVALDWVFTRIANFGKQPYYRGATFNISPQTNVLQGFFEELQDTWAIGDDMRVQMLLKQCAELLTAISNVLRTDQGLDLSDKLLEEYLHTIEVFLPWFLLFDLWLAFQAMTAAFQISTHDPLVVHRLSQSLDPQGRANLRQIALDQAWQGDRLAAQFVQFIF